MPLVGFLVRPWRQRLLPNLLDLLRVHLHQPPSLQLVFLAILAIQAVLDTGGS